jgi:hypothetical protein
MRAWTRPRVSFDLPLTLFGGAPKRALRTGARSAGSRAAGVTQSSRRVDGSGAQHEEPALPRADEFKAALLAEGIDPAIAEAAAELPPLKISTPEEIAARRAERRERIAREKAEGTRNADGSKVEP